MSKSESIINVLSALGFCIVIFLAVYYAKSSLDYSALAALILFFNNDKKEIK